MTKLKTVNISGKEYVTVNERIKYFRENHPGFSLRTELVLVDETQALVKAIVRDEADRIVSEGTAYERAGTSFINKGSHVENAETSAWGRALGNFGIGIDASVATADEVATAVMNKDRQPAPAKPTITKVLESLTDATDFAKLQALYDRAMTFNWSEDDLKGIADCYVNMKNRLSKTAA